MTAIDFPSSPAEGQVYLVGAMSWTWANGHWVSSYLSAGGEGSASMITIISTTALPAGYSGFVRVENAGDGPIGVFLPPSPSEGQAIEIKDTLGNAATYPITVDGFGKLIEGAATMVISFNYGWANLMYTGSQWVQM